MTVPEIDPTDPQVLMNPYTTYDQAREQHPVARMPVPGLGTLWVLTRYDSARSMLVDSRFALTDKSFMRPDIPEHCQAYMRTMSEMNGPEHLRLRRLTAPAFTPKRVATLRPRITEIVRDLIDAFPEGDVDLVEHFARPLPMDVICELVGVPDRANWRRYGAIVAAGIGKEFGEAVPAIIAGAKAAVRHRKAEPADDLIGYLLATTDLSEDEIVTLVWQLVIAGQTPANFITNAVEALLTHPDQDFLANPDVEELMRWCSPQLLTAPRYANEDVEIDGVQIKQGEPVTAAMVAANRDPRAFADPDTFDLDHDASGQLGFGHGPHFCLGASVARLQTEIALTELFRRFPGMKLKNAQRAPDGGTWRLASLIVTL